MGKCSLYSVHRHYDDISHRSATRSYMFVLFTGILQDLTDYVKETVRPADEYISFEKE